MSKSQWICKLSESDLQILLKSIDTVLFDVDGVLVHNKIPISGSEDAVTKFRKLGKKVAFVTNNSVYPLEIIQTHLKPYGASMEEIITPNASLLAHLEKVNFKRDIYMVSCSLPKKLLKEAGYNIIEYKDIQSVEVEETMNGIKQLSIKALEMCKNVGIVYMDLDLNCHHGSIQVAEVLLNHLVDVELITGMRDDMAPTDEKGRHICGLYYIDGIERWTKRKALEMAKPSEALEDVITSRFKISDNSRVLMIGDNISTDIAFGVNSGFKTCLVLTGITMKDQVEDWKFAEELKPDYVAASLGEIHEKIKHM